MDVNDSRFPAKVVVLAPNATEPALDGGSLRSLAFRDGFSRLGMNPTWIGRECSNIPGCERISAPNRKLIAAFRTLLRRTSYTNERHVGRDWRRAARAAVANMTSKADVIIWGNFVWSYAEWQLAGGGGRFYIDTHNSEREWFESLVRESRNLLVRRVALASIDYAEDIVRRLPKSTTLVHVSERDQFYYQNLAPQCRHKIVPNGCLERPPRQLPRIDGPPRLYFLGSLGAQMNFDALHNFAHVFWPALRAHATFEVFGSMPSDKVVQLCHSQGWPLHPNLPDAELDRLLFGFDVAVMPFAYAAGSKLKLIDALIRGMHVLSTPSGIQGNTGLPSTVAVGSSGGDWAAALQRMNLNSEQLGEESKAYARNYTWEKIIGSFISNEFGSINIKPDIITDKA